MVVFAVLLATACSAHAQIRGQSGPRGQPITRKALGEYARILDLSPEQREAAKSLFDGYRTSFTRLRETGDKELSGQHSADPNAPRPSRRQTGEVILRYVEGVEKLDASFFEDLRQLITADQEPRFDSVVRERRRESGLRFCFISGERLNLDTITRSLKIPREGDVGASLTEWEMQIDRMLTQKAALIKRVMARAFDSDDEMPDPRLIEELLKDLLEQGLRVRDTNRRFAREISQALPPEQREAFDREVRRASFPRIYVPASAELVARAIASRDDLTGEQRAAITDELPRCEREFAELNARIASIVEAKEEKAPGNAIAAMESRWNPPQDDLSEALAERASLDRRWNDRLVKMLAPEQRDTLARVDVPPLDYGRAFNLDPDFGNDEDDDDDDNQTARDEPDPP